MKTRQPFPGLIAAASAAVAFFASLAFDVVAAQAQGAGVGRPPAQVKHFDPNGNLPSTFTLELRKGVTATLPFDDKRDFDEAKKGLIAEPPYKQIKALADVP
jgi:alkyl sulfatase BDS1-like metallo-beta-lactamase superfamily hydrolase